MARYEVIESRAWRRDDGRTASIYGAVPWASDLEATRWKIEPRGFTVRDTVSGTVGIGKVPWATRAEAQSWADATNDRLTRVREVGLSLAREAERPRRKAKRRSKK